MEKLAKPGVTAKATFLSLPEAESALCAYAKQLLQKFGSEVCTLLFWHYLTQT